jgi:hypothetical protein
MSTRPGHPDNQLGAAPRAADTLGRSALLGGEGGADTPLDAGGGLLQSLRARAAAYRLQSLYDSRDLTANARTAFQDRFTKQVDPDGILPETERRRRAECARKAYYAGLAAKSAKARRERRGRRSRRG